VKANYFSEDIQEFIRPLFKHGVEYVIVGGEAVIYYGYPRLTGDIDFFMKLPRIMGIIYSIFKRSVSMNKGR